MSPAQRYRDTISNITMSYIEDRNLAPTLAAIDIPTFPIVQYVFFDEGVIHILVGGECAGCTAPFIRNTCNVQFSDYFCMIIREHFTFIRKVLPVLNHDGDLIYIMEEMGITIT